jgi:hypothetical protein
MPSFSLSKKYCRISGLISSSRKRRCAERRQAAKDQDRDQDQIEQLAIEDPEAEQQCRDDATNRKNDEAWRERKHQRFHGTPLGRLCRIILCWPQA